MDKITLIENGVERPVALNPTATTVTIGRAPENDIQITEKRASRKHVQIERLDAAWRLTDLGSSNGTRVNGEKVSTCALSEGDKIEIGETVILFGEPKPAQAAAIVSEPVVESTAPAQGSSAAPETPAAEKPASEVRRNRTTTRRRARELARATTGKERRGVVGRLVQDIREGIEREVPREYRSYLVAGLGLFVAVPFLFLVLYGVNRLTAGDNSKVASVAYDQGVAEMAKGDDALALALRLSAMGDVDAAGEAGADVATQHKEMEEHYASAREKFSEVVKFDADPRLTEEAKSRIDRMDKTLAENRQAVGELARVKDRVRAAGLTPTRTIAELAVLERQFGQTIAVGEIRRQIALARREQAKEIEKDLAAIESRANQEVARKRYYEAVQIWVQFAARFHNPNLDRKVEEHLRRIDRDALAAYEVVRQESDTLADQKRFDEARRLLENAIENFRGTTVPFKAKDSLTLLDLMIREGVDRERGLAMLAKQSRFRERAKEADDLARQKKYEQAMAIFREILGELGSSEDRELADLVAKYSDRIAELEKVVGLIEKLKEALANGRLAGAKYTDAAGMVHTIDSADGEVVHYSFHDGAATVPLAWEQHSAQDLYYLFCLLDLTVEDHFALAIFCFDNDLVAEGHRELIAILKAEPARKPEVDDFYAAKSGKQKPAEGFVVHDGRLMTALERDRHEDTKKIERLVGRIGLGGGEARQQTYKDLEEALAQAEKKYGPQFVADTKKDISDKLAEKKKQLLTGLEREMSGSGNVGQLRQLKSELDERRKHALELIFDEEKYPYDECHGCKAQPEVDKRVDSVREVWDRPADTAKTISPGVGEASDRVQEIDGFLSKVDPAHQADTGGMDLEYIKSLANKKLDIKNFGGSGPEMKKAATNNQTMDENASKQTIATAAERRQVEVTNQYRLMMGKNALRLDDRLVKAARGHSEFMQSSGQFDHVIPGHPNGATPQERCAKEGYAGAVGENISMGRESPEAVFDAWYRSSGHHRNMLSDGWKAMGAGQAGSYWTQNFGSQ